ncbi:MYG1 protein C27H6.8-like [Halichondria panicea]|uniref:MYG1 protein C27H6.8-like n=1 Tax=Halichondria panicea TaxID=6063 RepID=UPI00312B6433
MKLVGGEFEQCVKGLQNVWLPARINVRSAIEKRLEVHSSGAVLKLEEACPWKEHLFELERTLGLSESAKFMLYKEGDSDKWRVQAVPLHESGFENRLSLHTAWRGLRDEELSSVSGIPGCVFVHSSGFIGGNLTYEGALEMAVKTIESASN